MNEYQEPAEGVLKRNDWGYSKWYRVECECSSPNHAHEFDVEADEDGVTVSLYIDSHTPYQGNFWQDIKYRIRAALRLLFMGRIELGSDIILKEQVAINYANTLLSATQDVREFRDQKESPPGDE